MGYPLDRLQRYRRKSNLREIFSENNVTANDLIMPVFVSDSLQEPEPITVLPGMFQQTRDSLLKEIEYCVSLGIKAIILFGIPAHKDDRGSGAYDPNGVIQNAIHQIRCRFPELVIMADCCLCEYTDHGHCGLSPDLDGFGFDMDETLSALKKIAISYAELGVDVIAPSGMIDGMILTLREALDQAGYSHVLLLSYAVKYASAFYGPFRFAVGTKDDFKGDRLHHQLGVGQYREGIREATLDVQEGADILMVKPGMPYLDMIRSLRNRFDHPIVAYQVSGEYAMLCQAIESGILSEAEAIYETLIGFKRAGADLIISYFAKRYLEI